MQEVFNGGYFVSQQEQDAVIGRVVREHREASRKLELLNAEANRIGKQLEAVGGILLRYPERLVSQGENFKPEAVAAPTSLMPVDFPSAEAIQKLTRDIRSVRAEITDLERQKAGLL